MKLVLLRAYWLLTGAYLRSRSAQLGKGVRCNGFPSVRVRRGGKLLVGDGVMINAARWSNAHVTAGSTNFFVGSGGRLLLGARAGISGSRVVAMEEIEIGDGTLVGAGCLICDSDMHEVPLGSGAPVATRPVRIGKRVFVGAGSVILKGVTIGDGSVVGAGSVVSRDIPSNCLAAGNPAKVVRRLDPGESKSRDV